MSLHVGTLFNMQSSKKKKSVLCAETTGKGERFKVRWADKKNMKGRILPNALSSCPTL